jgi:hypothetical protein
MQKVIGISWIDPTMGGMGELVSTFDELVKVIEENKIKKCELTLYNKD